MGRPDECWPGKRGGGSGRGVKLEKLAILHDWAFYVVKLSVVYNTIQLIIRETECPSTKLLALSMTSSWNKLAVWIISVISASRFWDGDANPLTDIRSTAIPLADEEIDEVLFEEDDDVDLERHELFNA